MKINQLLKVIKEFLSHSFDGRSIEIIEHPDRSFLGLGIGTVVAETKKTMVIRFKDGKLKVVPKKGKFKFYLESFALLVPEKYLVGTPKTRSKLKIRRW